MQHPFLDSKHLYKSQFPWLTDYYPQNQGFGSGSNLSWQTGSRSMIFSWSDPDPGKKPEGSRRLCFLPKILIRDPDAGTGSGSREFLKLDPDKNHAQDVMSTGSENTETVFSVVDSLLALQCSSVDFLRSFKLHKGILTCVLSLFSF